MNDFDSGRRRQEEESKEALLYGSLEREYTEGYPPAHSEYVSRIIKEGLESGKLKKEDREQMWANYEHLWKHLEALPLEENPIKAIEAYLRDTKKDFSEEEYRYPFANKVLTKDSEGNYSGGLGIHLEEVEEDADKLLFTDPGSKESRFEDLIDSHSAALLADVASPFHDILKFLGSLSAQVMPDHEIMTAALVRGLFSGRTVELRGEEYKLTDEDVEFIANVIEDHENIGDNNYFREEGRDSLIGSDDVADRAKAFFFLLDTQTGVFEFSSDGKVSISAEQLEKRFADLYFRHVARYVYDQEKDEAVGKAKIFRPIWGSYALRDYIALFEEIEKTGVVFPNNWQSILTNKALLVLDEAKQEHYDLIENEAAFNPDSGERYSFDPDDIKEIQRTQKTLVFDLFRKHLLNSEDDSSKDDLDRLDVISTALEREHDFGEVVAVNRDQFIPFLEGLAEKVGLFDSDPINGVRDESEIRRMREMLVSKIMAHPSLFILDDLMHNQDVLDGAGEISFIGYKKRNDSDFNETEPLHISDTDRTASISGLVILQEVLGMFSNKERMPIEQVLKNILEGEITSEQLIVMTTMQKMQYLLGREYNGQAFTREPEFMSDSSMEHRREDWEQIKDNARFIANYLGVQFEEKDPAQLEGFLNQEMLSNTVKLGEENMLGFFKELLQNKKMMVDQAVLADKRYKIGVLDTMSDKELASMILRINDGQEYNWMFKESDSKIADASGVPLDIKKLKEVSEGTPWFEVFGNYPDTVNLFEDELKVNNLVEEIAQGKSIDDLTAEESVLIELRAMNMVSIYTAITTMMVFNDVHERAPEKILEILGGGKQTKENKGEEIIKFAQQTAHAFWYSSLFRRSKDRSLSRTAMPFGMVSSSEKEKELSQVKTGADVISSVLFNKTRSVE